MKLYTLKYKRDLEYAGLQWMWTITIRESARHDKGVMAHEVFHVKQWYLMVLLTVLAAILLGQYVDPLCYGIAGAAPWTHHALYKTAPYKRMSEGWATRIQLEAGAYAGKQWAVNWLKSHGMSDKWVKRWIG